MSTAPGIIQYLVEKADGIDERTGHYDAVLTDMSLAIQQETDGFVAGRVFNHISVPTNSGKYVTYPMEYQLRHGFGERGEGTRPNAINWNAKIDGTYNCKVYAARAIIGKQLRANVNTTVDPMRDTAEVLVEHSLIFKDEMWCDAFFKSGVWGLDLDGVTFASNPDPDTEFVYWNDYLNSDPIQDVSDIKVNFRESTGKEINKMVMGRRVYAALLNHPKILKRVMGGFSTAGENPAKANLRTLASLFEVDEIVIAQGIHDTNAETNPLAGANPSFIAGNHVLLCHSPPRVNLKKPLAGGHFCWTGYEEGVNNLGVVMDRWYDRDIKVWIMEMELAFGLHVIAPALGVFLENAVYVPA